MIDPEMLEALQGTTVPVWHKREPSAARALGVKSRNAAHKAAEAGDIPVIKIGRLRRVSCAWLRRRLELEQAA